MWKYDFTKHPVRPFFLILGGLLCFFFATELSAQQPRTEARTEALTEEGAAPEDPKVELPTVVLEYSAIEQEFIAPDLPEGDVIALPTIEELLPEAGALEVSSPNLLPSRPKYTEDTGPIEAAFFSEGVIGGGSDNHLIGDIALYKRGEMPLYQFRFSHEGIDGYGSNAAGTGYFDRREELSGKVEFGSGRNSGSVRASYFETETGLQDFNKANSVIHRFIRGSGSYTRDFEWPISLSARLTAHSGSQLIGMQDEAEEQFLEALTTGVFENDRWYAGLSGGYRYQQAPLDVQLQQGWAEFTSKLYFDRFDITGQVGSHWDTENRFLFPWNIELEGVAGDFLFRLGGGYSIEQLLYRDLWNRYPLLDTTDTLNLQRGWEVYSHLAFTPNSDLRVTAGADWNLLQGVIVPENLDARDSDSGLFPFTVDERELIGIQTQVTYYSGESLTLEAGWQGQLMDELEPLRPEHLITGGLTYSNRNTGFATSLKGDFEIGELPEMQVQMSYLLSEGINLILEGNDLLAPFYEDGRPWWGEYEQRGLNVTLKTEISL
ncbi:MAG TPA: hypothetical protein VJ967_05470 [Clostridia bacterium]|nr:hypothetical protein [Clostridia bacterium]